MKNNLPVLLDEIVNFIRDEGINLSKQARDGRLNPAVNEDQVFELLEKENRFKYINLLNIRD